MGAISASFDLSAALRHRCASSPSYEVVGGFFFDFELFRTASRDRDAPRRHMAYVGDTWLFTPGPASFWRRLHFGDERNARPGPRWKSAGDGVNGNLYIFGGHVERGSHSYYYDDMWVLSHQSTWREIPKGEVWPPARRGHAAAHADDLLVIVGGRQHHSECLRDAWAFNTTSEIWRKTSTPPKGSGYGCRWGHSATAIPPVPTAKDGSVQSEHTVAVFGGRRTGGPPCLKTKQE